jgi:hypothetical protein
MCKLAQRWKTYRSPGQLNQFSKEALDAMGALQDRQTHLYGGGRTAIQAATAAKADRSLCAASEIVLHLSESSQRSDRFVGFVVLIDEILHISSSSCEEAAEEGRDGVGDSVAGLVQS